ncbi:MAG: tRNA-uridine aminocarboxypropyltransferase [Myxococcota bacterium]
MPSEPRRKRSRRNASTTANHRTGRAPDAPPVEACPTCGKPLNVCVCDRSAPQDTRLRIVVLQHPQEQDVTLGTARLLPTNLKRAKVVVGLSWRSLNAALDDEVDPARWAVIFPRKGTAQGKGTRVVDKGGVVVPAKRIQGIIVLDGTWSQAKTLWWRNAWLLKLQRIVLEPREASIYGAMRREPKREFVSTLEAVADTLVALGEPEAVRDHLRRVFRTMLQRVRDAAKPTASASAPPERSPDEP